VAVFDQGKAGTVYLLSNNRVKKTFAGEDEVRGDPTALALLDNLNEIDARLKSEEQKLEKQIKATIQFRLGNIRQYKNAMAQMRMAGRAAAQKQEIQASQRRPP
jgi:hypothetical protein